MNGPPNLSAKIPLFRIRPTAAAREAELSEALANPEYRQLTHDMAQQAQQAQPNPEITDASKKRKRNPGVRATREQTEALQAAYEIDKSYSNEELDKLSSETGLTSQWIKSWFVRHKKKNQKERGSSEPDADVPPPPKKRGRRRNDPPTSTTHRIEAPAAKEPPAGNTSLPPLDHSLMPPSKPPSPAHTPASRPDRSFPSSSLSVELNPLRHPVQQPPAGYVNYGGFYMDPRYLPSRLPEQQKPSRSNSQHYPSSSYQNLPSSGPMLLPRMPENINPAPQRVSDQEYPPNAWGTYASPGINPPIRRSTVPPGALLGPHGRNTPASPALDTTPSLKSTTSFALIPAAVLHTPSPFVLNQQPPSQGTPTEPPFYMPKNTPAHVLQSPLFESPFSTQPSKHTNSMISPSALRSYMPEHDVEQNDSTSSTDSSFDTPIADKFLFSTMLNLTPEMREAASLSIRLPRDASALDIDKAPLKHLSILHAGLQNLEGSGEAAMTVDEMYERLLDESLATSDPFQAAMGLVFMSRTGLDWED